MRRVLASLLAALTLTACGAPDPPKAGYVVAKRHHPSRTDLIPITNCHGSGPSFSCTTSYVPIFHPESWGLVIRNPVADTKGRNREGEVTVDRKTFERYEVGQHYPDPA